MISSKVAGLYSPGSNDWIVTIVTSDLRSVSRRISPGTMDEKAALRIALCANGMSGNEVESWSIRRAGEAAVVVDEVDGFMEALRRRR